MLMTTRRNMFEFVSCHEYAESSTLESYVLSGIKPFVLRWVIATEDCRDLGYYSDVDCYSIQARRKTKYAYPVTLYTRGRSGCRWYGNGDRERVAVHVRTRNSG